MARRVYALSDRQYLRLPRSNSDSCVRDRRLTVRLQQAWAATAILHRVIGGSLFK